MYLRLAFKEMKRHKSFDVLIILLLTIAFALCIVMTSVIKYRFKFYSPFSDILNSKGNFISVYTGNMIEKNGNSRLVRCKEELKENLIKIKDIGGMYQLSPMYMDSRRIYGWSYDELIVEHYKPELKEGRWFSKKDADNDTIVAVVSGGILNVKPGDTITLQEDTYGHTLDVLIIGIIEEDTSIFGMNMERYGVCNDFYSTPTLINSAGIYGDSEFDIEKPYSTFFFLNDQLSRNPLFSDEAGGDGTGIQRVMTGSQFIIYEDDISEDEMEENNKAFLNFTMLQYLPLSNIKSNSIRYIFSQLNSVFPIFICIFLLTVIAIFSVEVFSVKEQFHNYAIFYIQGMPWKNCIRIHLSHQILLNISGLAVMSIIYFILRYVKHINLSVIQFTEIGVGICIILVILNLLIALIMPHIMIRKMSPVEILHTNYTR